MKRNEMAFTLIELLAVIVILAIIALIATPLAINVIEDAKKNAFKNTAYGLIDAVKLHHAEHYLNENVQDYEFVFPEADGLVYSGTVPDGGILRMTADGKISLAIYHDKWCVTKGVKDNDVVISKYEDNKCILPEETDIPIITLTGNSSIYLNINKAFTDPGYSVKTVGGEELSSEHMTITVKGQETGKTEIDTSIEEIYTITYTVTYKGNTRSKVRTVHVGNYKPTIQIEPNGTNGYVKESEAVISVTAFEQYHIDEFQYVIIKDEIKEKPVTIDKLNKTVKLTENGNYVIKVIATDSEGNTNEVTSDVYKIDTIPPTITFDEGDNTGIQIGINEVVTYDLKKDVSVNDNGTVTLDNISTKGSLEASVGIYPIIYQISDEAGNMSEKVRKVYVNRDTSSEGIYITEMTYKNGIDVISENTKMSAYKTTLDGNITLSSDNSESNVTFTFKVHNGNNLDYRLDQIIVDSSLMNNKNVTYSISGLNIDDIIESGETITFDITYEYKDNITPSAKINSFNFNINLVFDIVSYVVDTYDYTGNYEIFTAPHTGLYKIELWGAQGGGFTDYEGGKGGYVSGELRITQNTEFYIYVGGNGVGVTEQYIHILGGYNGGGNVMTELTSEIGTASTGGGATDIRIVSGEWNNFDSLKSRIMVASGGGGSNYYEQKYNGYGGPGGGLIGYNGTNYVIAGSSEAGNIGIGGTQKNGGYCEGCAELNGLMGGFGFGGSYVQDNGSNSGMGGSGYYGGGSGNRYRAGGGGGSSFISGHNGCDAVLESSTESNIIHSGQSVHYSGYQFKNTIMIDGKGYNWTTEKGNYVGMPTHDGTFTMTGNIGNGYAKITYIESVSE